MGDASEPICYCVKDFRFLGIFSGYAVLVVLCCTVQE